MAWCFSTRASVATALTTHPCVSRCLRVKQCDYISVLILTWANTNSEEILVLGTPAEGSDCQLLGFLVWKLPRCQQGAFQVMVLVRNPCITWSFKSAYKEYKYNNETVLFYYMIWSTAYPRGVSARQGEPGRWQVSPDYWFPERSSQNSLGHDSF